MKTSQKVVPSRNYDVMTNPLQEFFPVESLLLQISKKVSHYDLKHTFVDTPGCRHLTTFCLNCRNCLTLVTTSVNIFITVLYNVYFMNWVSV